MSELLSPTAATLISSLSHALSTLGNALDTNTGLLIDLSSQGDKSSGLKLWNEILNLISSIATVLGLSIGAAWAYFHFVRGRVYRRRLEPKIEAIISHKNEITYLYIAYELKNIGHPRTFIEHNGASLLIQSSQVFDSDKITGPRTAK